MKRPSTDIGKKKFYLLSFTWGLPCTLAGLILAIICRICGVKSEKYGYCRRYRFGKNWGGLEGGPFFFTDTTSSDHVSSHEHGHALQNCLYGPFMPLLVTIPSSTRYWGRRAKKLLTGKESSVPYDTPWFERQASEIGLEFIEKHNKQ